ncbi:MAG: methyltransferase domain-containing protein [Patescibacteria group bacterium]
MKDRTMNEMQQYIYDQEKKWFEIFKPYLKGSILKVGDGLGYLTEFMIEEKPNLAILEIQKHEDAMYKDKVVIYDGRHFPFKDKQFDAVVCTFVLHHTPHPVELLLEMKRVAKRIILIEETYSGILSKMDLVYRDTSVNMKAGQPSPIHWKSYFKKGELEKIFARENLEMVYHKEVKKRRYWKELFVVE